MSSSDSEEIKQFNVKFNIIPETTTEDFTQLFRGYHEGLVRSEPGNFVINQKYGKNAEKMYEMKLSSDVTWLSTFPKSGK